MTSPNADLPAIPNPRTHPPARSERMLEWTFVPGYDGPDPFNELEIDVVFEGLGRSWRVPAFWRGGDRWTVRFAPGAPGAFAWRVESSRPLGGLNELRGEVEIAPYVGDAALLRRGPFRVTEGGRFFEHADGTPFFWLADTIWAGMSTRLSWDDFREIVADRVDKGFTALQFVAGLVPDECPLDDLGYANEGGVVWEPGYARINPRYFDAMDRRFLHLIDAGLAPVLVGAWRWFISFMDAAKLRQHWRYLIARYGAYPVFWVAAGEVFDPPALADAPTFPGTGAPGEWTGVLAYLRSIDPYGHPTSMHENSAEDRQPVQDERLLDFRFFQPSHFGWSSIEFEVGVLTAHYARTAVRKPLVVGEIGYEGIGGIHLEDFQRIAVWLAFLNGAAGFSYGANALFAAYTSEDSFGSKRWGFDTWREALGYPGATQVGIAGSLLREHEWWRIEPRPDWVTPRGTTLLAARPDALNGFTVVLRPGVLGGLVPGLDPAQSEWNRRRGTFRLPYAAGIPGELRFVYLPYFQLISQPKTTVLGLESGVRYRASYWDPRRGVRVDLGSIGVSDPGEVLRRGALHATESGVATFPALAETDVLVSAEIDASADATLVARFTDPDDYVAATYRAGDRSLHILERVNGVTGRSKGNVAVPDLTGTVRIRLEVRAGHAAADLGSADITVATPIVEVGLVHPGSAGIRHVGAHPAHTPIVEVRRSTAIERPLIDRELRGARGEYRGRLAGRTNPYIDDSGLDAYGRAPLILLDAFQPEPVPFGGDWLLVLEVER